MQRHWPKLDQSRTPSPDGTKMADTFLGLTKRTVGSTVTLLASDLAAVFVGGSAECK